MKVDGDVDRYKDGLLILLRGILMGAADVVPGVSGGTIAFITGIYYRLLSALANISWSLWPVFLKEGGLAVWKKVDGGFLMLLCSGILLSIASLAQLISWLLVNYAEPLWALFFGLILASAWLLVKDIRAGFVHDHHPAILVCIGLVGAIFALILTLVIPIEVAPSRIMLFFAGAIAICAMILPGISGSFILLLMGLYGPVLNAIKQFDLGVLGIFCCGCLVGLLSMARLLNWLFKQYSAAISVFLVGIMLGSLNKIWPWKVAVTHRMNSHGEAVPLIQNNVMPFQYFDLTGHDPHLELVVILFISGLCAVLFLEKVTANEK